MKKLIEFVHSSAAQGVATPWRTTTKTTYKDLTLKPRFGERRFKFPIGDTWCRVLPALKTSTYGWMLGVHALDYQGGRHAHPKTLEPGSKSVFDYAYAWFHEHYPNKLYSKSNKDTGIRLLTSPMCLFWMITEVDGEPVARLILASGYDGSRGGTAGLGHRIWQLTQERNESGDLVCDPTDPLDGPQICISKQQAVGSRYPSYSLRLGRESKNLNDLIEKMGPEERDAIVPLENVIQIPSMQVEWELLKKVVDPDTVAKIQSSVS